MLYYCQGCPSNIRTHKSKGQWGAWFYFCCQWNYNLSSIQKWVIPGLSRCSMLPLELFGQKHPSIKYCHSFLEKNVEIALPPAAPCIGYKIWMETQWTVWGTGGMCCLFSLLYRRQANACCISCNFHMAFFLSQSRVCHNNLFLEVVSAWPTAV